MNSLDHLNKSQKEAVTMTNGNAFILAGAGTGKTSVLTHRIDWLIKERGVSLDEIIAVTFTNKAAKEMKERLSKMLGQPLKEAWIGTFHGLCHRILRAHTKLAGYKPHFTIMDEAEQLALIKRTLLANGQEPSKEDSTELQGFINRQKDVGLRAKDVVCGPKESMKRHWVSLYAAYEDRCMQENVIDFAELLMRVYEMWRDDEEFKEKFHMRFRYVLVDEFQDTSTLQYKWLRLLAGPKTTVFAVGDDDQCLLAGSKVLLENGERVAVENLKVGQSVVGMVGEKSISKKISRLKKKERVLSVVVNIECDEGRRISCTPDHVWFVLEQPPLEKESAGVVLAYTERAGQILHMVRHRGQKEFFEGYDSAWSHAQKLTGGKNIVQWANIGAVLSLQMKASDLRVGMHLLGEKGTVKIERITYEEAEVEVYDIDVEDIHHFVVNGLVSHNSIYSWRGAVVKNVESFILDYNAKLIKLEENYRSTAPILDLANHAIDQNPGRLGKVLRSNKSGHEKPVLHGLIDQQEEAFYVRDKIKELVAKGSSYKDIAIIYRTNALSRTFEQVLQQSAIPFKVFGGMRFFERQEVKHALAYLKVIASPEDDGALLRIVNTPPRGIGATSIEKVQEAARQTKSSFYDSIHDKMVLTGKAKTGLLSFKQMVEDLQGDMSNISSVADKLKYLLNKSGLRAWYEEQIRLGKEPDERLDNLDELVNAARGFEKEFPNATISDFLSTTALETSSNKTDKEGEVYVSLMTIHAAKGLEFESVFFVGVEDGIIPNSRCLESPEVEEERRLFYVAVTRAKRNLVMTICDQRMKYGERSTQSPSRFLKELPKLKDLVKYVGVPYIGRNLELRD
jgi:superfamily I DNA/RNA helicase